MDTPAMWSFVALEYHALILNRSYRLTVDEDAGLLVGKVCRGLTASDRDTGDELGNYLVGKLTVRGDLDDPGSYVSSRVVNRPHKADFRLRLGDVTSVRHDPRPKWGMSGHPHDGRLFIGTPAWGREREFILVGRQSGKEIAARLNEWVQRHRSSAPSASFPTQLAVPFDIDAIQQAVADLDARLRPIAEQPVDINADDWLETIENAPDPLDHAGVRAPAQALIATLLDAYATGGPSVRDDIRALLARYPSFTWATGPASPAPPMTAQGFRRFLLHLSAIDQTRDIRDTLLAVQAVCVEARQSGVETGHILAEVAALSSDTRHSLIGSLQSILQDAAIAR